VILAAKRFVALLVLAFCCMASMCQRPWTDNAKLGINGAGVALGTVEAVVVARIPVDPTPDLDSRYGPVIRDYGRARAALLAAEAALKAYKAQEGTASMCRAYRASLDAVSILDALAADLRAADVDVPVQLEAGTEMIRTAVGVVAPECTSGGER